MGWDIWFNLGGGYTQSKYRETANIQLVPFQKSFQGSLPVSVSACLWSSGTWQHTGSRRSSLPPGKPFQNHQLLFAWVRFIDQFYMWQRNLKWFLTFILGLVDVELRVDLGEGLGLELLSPHGQTLLAFFNFCFSSLVCEATQLSLFMQILPLLLYSPLPPKLSLELLNTFS